MTEELVNLICDLAEEMEGIDPEVAERFYKKGQADLLNEMLSTRPISLGMAEFVKIIAAEKGIQLESDQDG